METRRRGRRGVGGAAGAEEEQGEEVLVAAHGRTAGRPHLEMACAAFLRVLVLEGAALGVLGVDAADAAVALGGADLLAVVPGVEDAGRARGVAA